MTSNFRIAPRARSDLEGIWRYSFKTWSIDQAESYVADLNSCFEMLAANPRLGRELADVTPSVRVHTHKSHVIAYTVDGDDVRILRILATRQNWRDLLSI
ncbi:MAG: type II toxin-antitoxin system RelE/ParE family toxin [Geminicoccaceae bacterium]